MFTATPSDSGGGTEVAGNAYARVAVTNNSTNFPASASGVKSNGTVVTFPTATGSWGTASQFGTFDAATAGNFLHWGDLTTPKAIANGDVASFPIGSLVFTED